MKSRIEDPISTAWVESNVGLVSRRLLREEFESNPPLVREERKAKVRRLIAKYPRSYLAAHAREIYGI